MKKKYKTFCNFYLRQNFACKIVYLNIQQGEFYFIRTLLSHLLSLIIYQHHSSFDSFCRTKNNWNANYYNYFLYSFKIATKLGQIFALPYNVLSLDSRMIWILVQIIIFFKNNILNTYITSHNYDAIKRTRENFCTNVSCFALLMQ